jgi:hypothetical protein
VHRIASRLTHRELKPVSVIGFCVNLHTHLHRSSMLSSLGVFFVADIVPGVMPSGAAVLFVPDSPASEISRLILSNSCSMASDLPPLRT